MIAFDTDVLSLILAGEPGLVSRADALPDQDHAAPVVVIEEIVRGRLNAIRLAEAGKSRYGLTWAYEQFELTFATTRITRILSFTDGAEERFLHWKSQKIRVGTNDLRIAAICVAHDATLVTRNRRDFERVPGLKVEFWN